MIFKFLEVEDNFIGMICIIGVPDEQIHPPVKKDG
jgi:hypothetical protein